MRHLLTVFLVCILLSLPFRVSSGQNVVQEDKEEDAARIVFSSYSSGNWQIWSIDLDRRNHTQLTNTEQGLHYPAWSPDRTNIAFVDNEGAIWIMDLGNKPQKLQNLPPNCNHQPGHPTKTK